MNASRRGFLLSLFALLHCRRAREETRLRCVRCGMTIDERSHWRAGATSDDGRALFFDAPVCLLRYRLAHPGVRGEWVTEYYSPAGVRVDARSVRFVRGSDVVGPMGPDFVPVHPERVQTFLRDHHGASTFTLEQLTSAVLGG